MSVERISGLLGTKTGLAAPQNRGMEIIAAHLRLLKYFLLTAAIALFSKWLSAMMVAIALPET